MKYLLAACALLALPVALPAAAHGDKTAYNGSYSDRDTAYSGSYDDQSAYNGSYDRDYQRDADRDYDNDRHSDRGGLHANPRDMVEGAIGKPVYDLQDNFVGRVDGFINDNGTPAAIVRTSQAFGGDRHRVIMPADDIQPRDRGGMLAALSDSSVAQLYPYQPGQPLPVL